MIAIETFLESLRRGEIPQGPPVGTSSYGNNWNIGDIDSYKARDEVTARGMWAIVDKIWTKKLADWINNHLCLEVMAGAGWLAKALTEYGVNIIATDNGTWDKRHSKMQIVYPIEKLSAIASVRKYSDRDILIVSWPPYGDMAICRFCKKWTGKPIIYIGEGNGGCNAPDEFFKHFHYSDTVNIPMMAWNGLHDSVLIGEYIA